MRRVYLRNILVIAATMAVGIGVSNAAYACSSNQQSCTTQYGVTQVFFGNGGSLDTTCSSGTTHYCAQQSVGGLATSSGDLTPGSGGQYKALAGYNIYQEQPSLTLIVNDSSCLDYQSGGVNIDLGYLSTGSTKTANINFSVKTYLASGYIAKTWGAAPTSNGPSPHTLSTPTGSATPGTEKFGINLVANTGFGHNMQPLPDSTFSVGGPASGYGTGDSFKYTSGDTIAQASSSSGTSCYDMSYVFDISTSTQAGTYTMHQSVVVTSTF